MTVGPSRGFVYADGMYREHADITSPERMEQVRRSIAMLNTGALALDREDALWVLDALIARLRSQIGWKVHEGPVTAAFVERPEKLVRVVPEPTGAASVESYLWAAAVFTDPELRDHFEEAALETEGRTPVRDDFKWLIGE